MRTWFVAILFVPLVSGCLGNANLASNESATAPVAPLAARIHALVGDVPCSNDAPIAYDTDTDNLRLVHHVGLDTYAYGGVGEAWLTDDRAYVARYATGGAAIVDISDPAAPIELSVWDPSDGRRALDIKLTSDGTGLLIGHDNGIDILDIRHDAEPVLEHSHPMTEGSAHMMTVMSLDGIDHVSATGGEGHDMPIYRIDGAPGNRSLTLVASPVIGTVPTLTGTWHTPPLHRPHDAFFHHDPLLDLPVLWVAAPFIGLIAYDMTDPAAPDEIARIPNIKPQYTHTVQTIIQDDTRITISISEVGYNTMKVFDTTDLDAPVLLAEWSITEAVRPQHNLQIVPPYVYVAHYAEGVFVFALDDLLSGRTEPVAHAKAISKAESTGNGAVDALGATGLVDGVWDVGLRNGLLYVTDGGLRVFTFGCLTPGDPTQSSIG